MDTNTQNRASSSMGLVFAAGLFAGYVASLIMPENAEEAKEKLSKGAQQLKETVTDPRNVGKVKSLINGKGIDVMSLYMDTRAQIMEELTSSKENWEELDKGKYMKMLKKALEQLVEEQDIPEKELQTLQGYLEDDYKTFRSQSSKSKKVA